MRRVACYSIQSPLREGESPRKALAETVEIIRNWVRAKGAQDVGPEAHRFPMKGSSTAVVWLREHEIGNELEVELLLEEETQPGTFLTRICTAYVEAKGLCLFLELRAGGEGRPLAPYSIVIRCPQVLRALLEARTWHVGAIPVGTRPIRWFGDDVARRMSAVLDHPDRALPLIIVSESSGKPLTETLAEDIAADVAGLAIVAHINEAASWALTRLRGREWSCFDGSIRLYWPRAGRPSSAYDHPIWLRARMLEKAGSATAAASRIRDQLRKQLVEISTYTFDEPADLLRIRESAVRAAFETQLDEANKSGEQKQVAEHWFGEAQRLESKCNQLQERVEELEDKNDELQLAVRHRSPHQTEDLPAETASPLKSIDEAVQRARQEFVDELMFGADVERGVEGLQKNACAPDRVFENLGALAEMTRLRRKDALGVDAIKWLTSKGVPASTESMSVTRSDDEMRKRTWDGGDGLRMQFMMHLKPKEGTSPDRCVRIYFKYREDIEKTVVGWIGRHP